MNGQWRLLACALASCLALSAHSAEEGDAAGGGVVGSGGPGETFRISGFATLGAVRTSTDDVEFVRDLSQARGAKKNWTAKTDSLLGLQADWQPTPQWQVTVQGLSRYRFDRTFQPEFSWAFVKYQPDPNISLRLGRLGTEFFMQADSRWVGYSFLSVRPAGDYFWYLPFHTIDGADASLNQVVGEGVLRSNLFYGISRGKAPLADEQWNISGSPMLGGYLEYQHGPWTGRVGYANIRFAHDLPLVPVLASEGVSISPADAQLLQLEGKRSHYYALGLVYDQGPLQVQAMLNRIDQGTRALEDSSAAYVLAGYRVREWTPYLGVSRVYSRRAGNGKGPVVAAVRASSHSDQKTVFVGTRWDFARNLALKAQWDRVRGRPASIFPYRMEDVARWNGKVDVFSLSLDVVF